MADDPDTILTESSVPEVRALEQKTRNDIETQKKELRAMVGEQYLDLISAADAIITMSKNAQAIQSNFERMQAACNVEQFKLNAKKTILEQDQQNNQTRIDNKRKYVYIIAALVKSLADVPEQIWHALENHRYLHASRLFILAKKVHDYLEQEKDKSAIDIEVAFPVIQTQWNAVSAFRSQIISRATHYLRVSEQSSEHVAEVIVGLMLLDELSYKESVQKLLEMRTDVIRDIVVQNKNVDSHRMTHQLREVTLIIKRTLKQVFDIYYSTLIESYVDSFKKTFLIPSKSSHGNETPSQPAITRLFSPSSNVHLIVRYLPDSIQHALPEFEPAPKLTTKDVQQLAQIWIKQVEDLLTDQFPHSLEKAANNQVELIQVRNKLWELLADDELNWQKTSHTLLATDYCLWDHIYRSLFNQKAKNMINTALSHLSDQPSSQVWPMMTKNKNFSLSMHVWSDHAFHLPNFSSTKEIQTFKDSLKETANDRTGLLVQLQSLFDTCLLDLRMDVQKAYLIPMDHDNFYIKQDTEMIKIFFQDACFNAVVKYAQNLTTVMYHIDQWTSDEKKKNLVSIFLGRLTRNIAVLSKELPKALLLSAEMVPVFELRSYINKDPKYTELQSQLTDTFHRAHEPWITFINKEFGNKLKSVLHTTQWDDQCAATSIWENVEEDIKLPTQASHTIVRAIFYVCQQIQEINSAIIDQFIMTNLRQQLHATVLNVYDAYLSSNLESITENGALQLLFDYLFLNTVLLRPTALDTVVQKLQQHMDPINWASYEPHFNPCIDKFYIKQSLLLGVLTSATNETFERARKIMSTSSQQYNVLSLASQAVRFTLLPIGGHLNSSSIRTR